MHPKALLVRDRNQVKFSKWGFLHQKARVTAAREDNVGEISVKIQMHKNDLGDTESSLEDNSKFYGDLKRDCSKKTAEYEERCEMRRSGS